MPALLLLMNATSSQIVFLLGQAAHLSALIQLIRCAHWCLTYYVLLRRVVPEYREILISFEELSIP